MTKAYNVFISWSGARSRHIAEALREWLPMVIQATAPWMSESDIDKGSRGLAEISGILEGIKVGIVCLTPENLTASWILYEAGALSKTIDDKTHLCTYLLGGLRFQDVAPPLGIFQHTKAEREDTRKLLHSINKAVGETPLADAILDKLLDKFWPELEQALRSMPPPEKSAEPRRSAEEMLTEVLEFTRADANRQEKIFDYQHKMAIEHQMRLEQLTAENMSLLAKLRATEASESKKVFAFKFKGTGEERLIAALSVTDEGNGTMKLRVSQGGSRGALRVNNVESVRPVEVELLE